MPGSRAALPPLAETTRETAPEKRRGVDPSPPAPGAAGVADLPGAPPLPAGAVSSAARGAKREHILEAAIRVFALHGYHGARVSDIAAEAGIAYGLVYHYFKNKEEILRTIFDERWNAFLRVVEQVTQGPGTAAEKLHALAGLVLYAYRRRPDWVKVLVFEIRRSSRFSEPEQIRAVGRLFRSVECVLRNGQEAGELRDDIDPQVACLAYVGALETMITSQVLGVMQLPEEPDASDDRTVRAVVELFLGGLRAGRAQ